jgi:hypothetical protein
MRLALGLLECPGRHTITGMLSASGRDQHDWSADYRVFSRGRFSVSDLFGLVEDRLLERSPAGERVVTALDDTKLHKTGTKIPGVSYQRDPMSPPFRPNFIRAQRFAQLSMVAPLDVSQPTAARCLPVDFRHVPAVPRPGPKASEQEVAEYKTRKKEQNLSVAGATIISEFRASLDSRAAQARQLVVCVDGSYTNQTILKHLPERTTLIGRIRKDAKFFSLPTSQSDRGRPRVYGDRLPTPDEIRKDDSVPWQKTRVWASGKFHDCEFKSIAPVLWKKSGLDRPLRLIIIRPLGYRPSKSRLLYRQPAFLICTDPDLPLATVIQDYFRRWDIEVNHRDEKQLIGVGQAQVRSPLSVELVPAFAVASYSMLLLASGLCRGFATTSPVCPIPKWQRSSVSQQHRLTTGQILSEFRSPASALRSNGSLPNFDHFEDRLARHLKCPKSSLSRETAVAYAMQ